MKTLLYLCVSVSLFSALQCEEYDFEEEAKGIAILERLNSQVISECNNRAEKEWNYASNITDFNRKAAAESAVHYAKFWKRQWKHIKNINWRKFKDPDVKRQFKLLSTLGSSILPEARFREYNQLKHTMETIYARAKVCDFNNPDQCAWYIEPELTEIMRESRDEELLRYIWVEWRRLTGAKMRQNFTDMLEIVNEIAWLNNFTDASEYHTRAYESKFFKQDIETLWKQLRPFYKELHAYVRSRLRKLYGSHLISKRGLIPAHLLGNMWAQSWDNTYKLMIPFPHRSSVDVTPTMKAIGLTPIDMVKMAEDFFISLNLTEMPPEFWKNSIFIKPKDREMICHASAWDMCNQKDFRIKQCTRVNMEDLITLVYLQYYTNKEITNICGHIFVPNLVTRITVLYGCEWLPVNDSVDLKRACALQRKAGYRIWCRNEHHEMGHTQYQIQYKHLPKVFHDGANPGFHEAIGDLIALSVQTPKHLTAIGLLEEDDHPEEEDYQTSLNFLMKVALEKVAFLPFGYLMDLWRWQLYDGSVDTDSMNCEWWDLRQKYQGVKPPVLRSEEDFDAGSKYHVAANVNYIRYFVSMIIQFQFHEALCIEAGEFDPTDENNFLHDCDIYGSYAAGNKLKSILQMGASRPWPDAMEKITGSRRMDAGPLLHYFRPLIDWLKAENRKHKEHVGWDLEDLDKLCTPSKKNEARSTSINFLSYIFPIVLYHLLCY